jgi:ubiquinone/menaquinone biosynthesis C-methylase UbiE
MKSKFNYDGKFKKLYYKTTSEINESFDKDIAFKKIVNFLDKKDVLCEFGCGDGSKLMHLKKYVRKIYGFDISREAIKRAKKNVPDGFFSVSDSGKIFKEGKFDVTIAIATLEHVEDPQKFLNEMLKATKKGGYVIVYNPNFGSPLCPSPPIIHNKSFFQRIFIVIIRLYKYKRNYKNNIYKSINPILDQDWQPDFDTISEISLESVARKYKSKIVYANSFWKSKPFIYFIFYLLSILGIKPIKYWGFMCFFVIKK